MVRRRVAILLSGLVLMCVPSMAPSLVQAEEMPVRGPVPFATYDKDGDGLVSEGEFNLVRGQRMATRATEGRPMRGAATAPPFAAFDTDGDGQLTADKLPAGQRMQMWKRPGMSMGMSAGQQGRGMSRGMPVFPDYDLNGDGSIGEGEFARARGKRMAERVQQGYRLKNAGNMPAFADIDAN